MTAEDFSTGLIQNLKGRGYKKKRLTWYKEEADITIVFQIQKSQYSSQVWYYIFGVGINSFFETPITSISQCDIVEKLEQSMNGKIITTEHVLKAIGIWEEKYGTLSFLRKVAIEGHLPAQSTLKAIRFLTTIM